MPPTLPILHVTLRYTGPAAERAALALREIAASVAMIEGTVAVIETREDEPLRGLAGIDTMRSIAH